MKIEEAIKVLETVAEKFVASGHDHKVIQAALKLVKEKLLVKKEEENG